MTARTAAGLPAVTEAGFQEAVVELARLRGWLVAHFRPARTNHGWRTPVQGDPGFPDLVLVRAPRVLFIELKRQNGTVTAEQWRWINAIAGTEAEAWVWRPSDWPTIERMLAPDGAAGVTPVLPPTDRDAPDGFEWRWTTEDPLLEWRVVPPDEARPCRMMGAGHKVCRRPSVAALNRGRWAPGGRAPSWWHYCADHLFGRVLVDGAIYVQKLVKTSADGAGTSVVGASASGGKTASGRSLVAPAPAPVSTSPQAG